MSEVLGGIRRRFGVRTAYGALELAILAFLALAAAMLVWAIFRPIGPVGPWQPRVAAAAPAPTGFSALDPLFGFQADGGPLVVSSSGITLHGLRMDNASGRGSAILSSEGEPQRSYEVGEEVVPGVTLAEVAVDHVVLSRGGNAEALFFEDVAPGEANRPTPVRAAPVPAASPQGGRRPLTDLVRLTPRDGGGLAVSAGQDAALFARSGFRAGDAILTINGEAVTSPADMQRLMTQQSAGTPVRIEIERGGTRQPLTIRIPGQ